MSAASPPRACVLALDQGTSSSRAILFDERARVVAMASRELAARYPRPGWVEQDAEDIWQGQIDCAREVLARAGVPAAALAAIGITNQRETTVLWDRASGRPLAPAIVWQDRRTAAACEQQRALGREEEIRARTGLVLDPYFSATKLAWLLDHVPGARQRAERGELAFGTVDAWLLFRLTDGAVHATDPGNASRTQLFHLEHRAWDEQLLDWFDIPAAVLPTVVPSSGVVGRSAAHWLGAAVPIAGIAGDQQAATFGQACFAPGMAKNTYGTGCFLMLQMGGQPRPAGPGLLTTLGWQLGGGQRAATCYLAEGSVFVGGALVQWLRDGLGLFAHAADVEALAASVADSGGVVVVPAFAGLGAPHWDPHARGSVFGLTRGTTRAHLARAALEAIALQSAELLDALQEQAPAPLRELRVDGGAARNDLLLQIQADLLGVPVVRPQVIETTALGAAFLAGLAAGVWDDTAQLEGLWQRERVFEPGPGRAVKAALVDRWRRAVERSRGWMETEPR